LRGKRRNTEPQKDAEDRKGGDPTAAQLVKELAIRRVAVPFSLAKLPVGKSKVMMPRPVKLDRVNPPTTGIIKKNHRGWAIRESDRETIACFGALQNK